MFVFGIIETAAAGVNAQTSSIHFESTDHIDPYIIEFNRTKDLDDTEVV